MVATKSLEEIARDAGFELDGERISAAKNVKCF